MKDRKSGGVGMSLGFRIAAFDDDGGNRDAVAVYWWQSKRCEGLAHGEYLTEMVMGSQDAQGRVPWTGFCVMEGLKAVLKRMGAWRIEWRLQMERSMEKSPAAM
ncbi:hypothetical protein JB92DRAFT_2827870 [Gautieria morchelliformis]|nr:hypothetical protein JB92DRAFT_2827870 [Gautieria morchelliformis]